MSTSAAVCPNCLSPLPADVVECPECLFPIPPTPMAPPTAPPDHAGQLPVHAAAGAATNATERGVASAGDIEAPVFTGDIHGNVTVEIGAKRPAIPPPPPPERPPDTSAFLGRESELRAFAGRLEQTHLAVITGMPGVGKTALAAVLAQRCGVPALTFWHTFHPDEGIETLIWQMAGFLGFHGRRDLWDLLYHARQGGSQPPPPEVLFNYLLQMLRDSAPGGGYLLCLDDFHFVYDEPLFDRLIGALLQAIRAGELRLILTSRRVPGFASPGDYEPLAGLSFADTQTLLAARQVSLPDALVHDVYIATGGNAQLLILATNALHRSRTPAALASRLVDAGDIEDYLIREVDGTLSGEERRALSAIAALLGYPASREAVEALLGGESLRRVLLELSRAHLLVVTEGDVGREYRLHAMLQAFYYDLIAKSERAVMHQRAGTYYEKEEPDALKAARHWERAGDAARAVRLVQRDMGLLMNRGEARGLRVLLERFTQETLEPGMWVPVLLARGEIYTLLGEPGQACQSFAGGLATLEALPASPGNILQRARACRGMGSALELSEPQQALSWLERGLAELAQIDSPAGSRPTAVLLEQAALLVKTGSLQIALGRTGPALEALEQSLQLLPEGPHPLRGGVYTNLANIYGMQGDMQKAEACIRRGLEMCEQLKDYFRVVRLSNNLGLVQKIGGDWPGAVATYTKALELAERLGMVTQREKLLTNLGVLYTEQGKWDLAEDCIIRSLEGARQSGNREEEVNNRINLAQLWLKRGEPERAETCLAEALRLAAECEVRYALPDAYRLQAELHLCARRPAEALAEAEQSIELAREQEMEPEAAKALRVSAQALAGLGRMGAAQARFAESAGLLEAGETYAFACTKLAWGTSLLEHGQAAAGEPLLSEAEAIFRRLGAQADLQALQAARIANRDQ